MRWILAMLMGLFLMVNVGCVFSEDDGTPDSVIVDTNDPPASNTTIIEDNDPPAVDDVDVNVDATP